MNRSKIGRENSLRGMAAEKLVQQKLWFYGYGVERFSRNCSFDLLVNGKIKVEVKSVKFIIEKNKISWRGGIGILCPSNFDILAVVMFMPISKPMVLFYTKKEAEKLFLTNIYFTNRKDKKLLMGIKKPRDVFGETKIKGRS